MKTVDFILMQFKNANKLLADTMADVKEEQLHLDPGGTASTVAALYGHIIHSCDWVINELLQGKQKLGETDYKDKTGFDIAYPNFTDPEGPAKWQKTVKVDMSVFKEYANAVQKTAEDYIAGLTDEDLDKEIELNMLGKQKLAFILDAFLISHINNHIGEISAVKGVHGLKGYPF